MTLEDLNLILLADFLSKNDSSEIIKYTVDKSGNNKQDQLELEEFIFDLLDKGLNPLGELSNGEILSINYQPFILVKLLDISNSLSNNLLRKKIFDSIKPDAFKNWTNDQKMKLMREVISYPQNQEELFKKGWCFQQGEDSNAPEVEWAVNGINGALEFFQNLLKYDKQFDFGKLYEDTYSNDKMTIAQILRIEQEEIKTKFNDRQQNLLVLFESMQTYQKMQQELPINQNKITSLKI